MLRLVLSNISIKVVNSPTKLSTLLHIKSASVVFPDLSSSSPIPTFVSKCLIFSYKNDDYDSNSLHRSSIFLHLSHSSLADAANSIPSEDITLSPSDVLKWAPDSSVENYWIFGGSFFYMVDLLFFFLTDDFTDLALLASLYDLSCENVFILSSLLP